MVEPYCRYHRCNKVISPNTPVTYDPTTRRVYDSLLCALQDKGISPERVFGTTEDPAPELRELTLEEALVCRSRRE